MTQQFLAVEKVDLVNKVLDMKKVGFRLAQICATHLDNGLRNNKPKPNETYDGQERRGKTMTGSFYILHYSFVKDNALVTFRTVLEPDQVLESIAFLYPYAFLYENELHDLFGIPVINMNIDFKGHLYETAVKAPFATSAEKEVKQNG